MNNIIKIFLSDWKRLRSNVVAMVIITGLIVLPSLYSWFNIMSNWDPYGTSATSQMSISFFSEDSGYSIEGYELNVGETITSTLESNDTINWVFTDSAEDAIEKVKSGECYAGLVVSKDFSKNLLSFITGTPVNPVIEYYENDKKNAIATKISSKVESTIKNQINSTFVSTLGKYLAEAGQVIWGEDSIGQTLKESSLKSISTVETDLDSLTALLNSFKAVTDSASGTVDTVNSLTPSLNSTIEAAKSEVSLIDGSLQIGSDTSTSIKNLVDSSIDTLVTELDTLNTLGSLSAVSVDTDQMQSIRDSFETLGNTTFDILSKYVDTDNTHYVKAKKNFDKILDALDTYLDQVTNLSDAASNLKTTLQSECAVLKSALYEAKSTFDSVATTEIPNVISSMESAVSKAQNALNNAGSSLPDISSRLSDLKDRIDSGSATIDDLIEYVATLKDNLSKLTDKINNLTDSEVMQSLEELLSSDPEIITEFLKSPVSMETVKLYEIGNYGSAMAPFYTILGLWVGSLILVAILKVKVRNVPELMDTKSHERFIGRYLTFFVISQAQTLLCVLGNLIYIRISCVHPVLFVVAAVVTSFVFSLIMYSLTVALGNVGQAISIILLVIQVAGSGGTFPIEVLPGLYQTIYKFLPFTYSLDAMRECIGGFYGNNYIKDLGILLLFAAGFVAFAAIIRKPLKQTNYKIEDSKDNSGVML